MAGNVSDSEKIAALEEFAEAGNRHDIDGMMSLFTDDCIFDSSFGPDAYGTRYVGYDQVKEGLQSFLDLAGDGRWTNVRHFVGGDRGVSEWTYVGTTSDGTRVEVDGCDLLMFRGNKVTVKNSFRKSRTSS